ncbi:hypothetical protein ACKXF7_05300 [Faecalibacterium sp. 7]|uniref:hypothetical protein n=1 Tax=Faecalibacterium sp. 7 TaxID=3402017 RepID=UPI003C2C52FB
MTNKKFKLAAMSLALTACVAASPLAANAESADAEVNKPASTAATSTDETKQNPTDETKQNPTDETKQNPTDETKQNPTDEIKQNPTDEIKQNPTDETKQNPTDETKQNPTDETKQNPTDEIKQNPTDEIKQNPTDETKQNPTDEIKQNPTDEIKQNPTDETKQNPTDETKQNPTDETKQNPTDETKQNPTDETKQNPTDETKQNPTDETKQNPTDESKQNPTDESKQNPADESKPQAAVENNDLAVAPAPVLMLAKAPAAPATPAEDNTVATITGQDGKTTGYTSFDEAVSKANDGDTIEVVKDATSTGIDLRDKKLTIKGKTVTTATDSGTEEKTTVKPKLKFIAKEGQSQIVGITLWGSNLTFQNMDVDMTGASSTTYNKWNAVCMSHDAALTLDNTKFSMDGTGLATEAHGIYMAGRGRNELNVNNHSTLTINNCFNAIAWDGVGGGNEGSTYFINITDGSTFTADGNNGGIIGREALDVLVDNSTLTVTNCANRGDWEGRSGFNGADVKIVNGSTANISGNHGGYGIHANNLLVENSTLTANDNGYGGIRITGKGEFTNSTVTVTGTEEKGNASVEITWGVNDTETGLLNGSLSVRNSTLNISDNNATGIACLTYGGFHRSLTIDDASRVTIQNNNATPRNGFNAKGAVGGGLRIEAGCSAVLGRSTVINNNSADKAGADIFTEKGGKLTFSVGNAGIGDILQDCGDGIDGWYIDAEGQRWNFHGDPSVAQDLLDSNVALDSMGDGTYTLTVTGEPLALKAAHAELPAPTPEPDGSDTPTPDPDPKPEPKPEPKPGPDTSVTPEDPQLTPVQDARTDTPDSSVLPANHTNPAVQDAHALPQTGTSLFAALAMALSGFALTIAGAWASLLGKNSRH